MKRLRIVVAGQTPPPYGGQNIIIEKAVKQFADSEGCEAVHLPFRFTLDFQHLSKVSLAKALELLRVLWRLLRIRLRGPIDLLLYPAGGPHTVPIIRDILLLPWMLLLSRRLVLHFHAAGIGDRFPRDSRHPVAATLRRIYRKASAAIVMTKVNRTDPENFGISEILVLPHRLTDDYAAALISRSGDNKARLLYVGHLSPDKGTLHLLQGFAAIRLTHTDLTLELVGECLPPWRQPDLDHVLDRLQLRSAVTLSGVLTGRAKAQAFGRADLFVFPSVAPSESFGLVLIEAMMWHLPIIATAWRGNTEVLSPGFGGITIPVEQPLHRRIECGLTEALRHREEWQHWGKRNRTIFEDRYLERPGDRWLADACLSLSERC